MTPNMPRKLLWTDRKNISEFLSNELGSDVVSCFTFAYTRITAALDANTLLMLFNEAFYYSTRVVYEQNSEANPETYMEKIKNDMDNEELSKYVINIMYIVLCLQSNKSNEILQFIDKLQTKYLPQTTFRIIKYINKVFKPKTKRADFILKPHPCSPDELNDIDWEKVTQGFSKQIIVDILDFWDTDNDKGKVIKQIENADTACQHELENDKQTDQADEEFFTQQKNLYKVSNDDKILNASECVPKNCFKDGIDKEYVRDRVNKLVQEFYIGEDANLALIELVLFNHGLLKKYNTHKPFVKILKDWGELPKKLDRAQDIKDTERIANNMSQKYHELNNKVNNILKYKEWNNNLYERKKCISIEIKLVQLMNWQKKD